MTSSTIAGGAWQQFRVYLEMIKFSHTVFALPFALLAAALAVHRVGELRLLDFVGILLCMVFARTAAMSFNRWADRALDARNPRTASRAIPAGLLSPALVLGSAALAGLAFIAATGLFYLSSGNTWPLILAAPVLAILWGYSYAKRFTSLAHVWLGASLALAPVAAWLAIRGQIEPPALWLAAAVICWVSGFDILYACQDIDTDRRERLHSIPAAIGFERSLWVARGFHAAMLIMLGILGWVTPELGRFYWLAYGAVAALLALEHWLARDQNLARINLAFLQVNAAISLLLLAATVADLWWAKG